MSYCNQRKGNFLASIPTASIEDNSDTITKKCKFNFSFFEKQEFGQSFSDLDQMALAKLLEKLKEFSRESLDYWKKMPVGHGTSRIFSIYHKFPNPSNFQHPKHVPHQAMWGRFWLEGDLRLVGFVIPDSFHGKEHPGTKERFDCNTFFVVFYDDRHQFYLPKK